MNHLTGYGKMEIGLWRGLFNNGVDVRFDLDPTCDLTLVTARPEAGLHMRTGKQPLWLYTMSESTRVSQRWVDQINELYDRVLVPCPPLVKIYHDSGVEVPVSYVPLGVDLWEPEFNLRKVAEPTNYLTYSLGDMRKGAELFIVAFKHLFGNDSSKHLYIKARDHSDTWIDACEDEQITIVKGQKSESDWHQLLAQSHIFGMPTRAEGWNMPAREAVLSGLPTLCTEWLGTWDIAKWGTPIPVKELRPSTFDYEAANHKSGLWAEPNRVHMMKSLEHMTDNYAEYQQHTIEGNAYLRENFSWQQTASKLMELR